MESKIIGSIPKIKYRSLITIGRDLTYTIMIDHHFTWLQKKMIKWLLGFDVYDYSESEDEQDGKDGS